MEFDLGGVNFAASGSTSVFRCINFSVGVRVSLINSSANAPCASLGSFFISSGILGSGLYDFNKAAASSASLINVSAAAAVGAGLNSFPNFPAKGSAAAVTAGSAPSSL